MPLPRKSSQIAAMPIYCRIGAKAFNGPFNALQVAPDAPLSKSSRSLIQVLPDCLSC